MSEPMVEQEETVNPPAVRVGDLLRQARESRGLSVGEIARTLKLGERQLEALEASQWSGLPGHTFIRGFVRNYARLVNIDPAPLMVQLERELEPPRDTLDVPETRPASVPYSGFDASRKSRQMVFLGAVVLLLAASAYFLMPNDLSALRANAQDLLDSVGRKEQPVAPASIGQEPALPPGQTLQQTLNPQALAPSEAEPAVKFAEAPTVVKSDPVGASMAPTLTPPPSLQPSPVVTTTAPASPAPVAAPAVALSNSPQIRLVADKMAWVEIRDRDNKPVFSQRMAAGVEQALSGQGPLSVVIGYAPGVRLFWHGQAIDLAPHTKGDVARLVLE